MKCNAYNLILALFLLYLLENCAAQILFENCIFASDQCPNVDITFWLYKNQTQFDPVLLNPLNLSASSFEPKLPLKILIHGFNGNSSSSPNLEVRPALLHTQLVNVISVDYKSLTRFPCYYPWSVLNAPIVARCVAQLLDNLITNGIYTSEEIHVIGFSLGAQIAGLMANYIQNRLKRVTGLDPARPGFITTNLNDKLDATDAEFIDIIHTDWILYSSIETMGHADFYPNLDNYFQPGCYYYQNGQFRNCNHFRAPEYYAESVISEQGFWAYNCGNWFEFVLQRCRNYAHIPDAKMGYFVSENATGSYYLTTNPQSPFAKGPLVDVEFEVIDKLK